MQFVQMMRRLRGRVALVGLCSMLVASSGAPSGAQEAQGPQRIVTVGGALTEIVFALGEEERLVARDSTSLYPQAALDLPDIGYMRALSPEGVLSVNPDLIIALEGSGPPEALDVLQRASVELALVPERYDGKGIAERIMAVGALLGVSERAEALARSIEADIQAAGAAARAQERRPRVLFVLSMSGGRIMASGTGTAADAIIGLAGGENVITQFEGYKQLTDEAVIEVAPEIILMMDRQGEHDAGEDELFAHAAIAPTPAGQGRHSIRMNGPLLLGFGPRTGEAVRQLSAAFTALAIPTE